MQLKLILHLLIGLIVLLFSCAGNNSTRIEETQQNAEDTVEISETKGNEPQQDPQTLNVQIGDKIYFGNCDSQIFDYVDLLIKTRWERLIPYDTLTGSGFYNAHFLNGDFDGQDLPCQYSGEYCTLVSVESLEMKDGSTMQVMFGRLPDQPEAIIWIQAEEALLSGEISLKK